MKTIIKIHKKTLITYVVIILIISFGIGIPMAFLSIHLIGKGDNTSLQEDSVRKNNVQMTSKDTKTIRFIHKKE